MRSERLVAIKIVKSSDHYTETALDEVQLCQKVVRWGKNALLINYET